jgi:hypothetical protein
MSAGAAGAGGLAVAGESYIVSQQMGITSDDPLGINAPPVAASIETHSETRSQAFQEAKRANGIPTSAQPEQVVKPDTPQGAKDGLRRNENMRLYKFTNNQGKEIWIREDGAVVYPDGGRQRPHFNSGVGGKDNKLRNHHYWRGRLR